MSTRSTRRLSLATTLVLGLVALSLAACSAGSPASAPAAAVTVGAPVEPSPSRTTAPVEPGEASATPGSVETFTMPELVGVNLQRGQDILREAGASLLDHTDASGLERDQVNDSNWRICTQDPAAGVLVPVETRVTLAAVKVEEICP
ncbi:hypothetical protein [Cellulomonas xylanilytica]|uniref:PASTA domain-containing protein n=1 Tax=Cellulomonas xylanilytica TaxID=233583 RepID=A0A510V5G0_9CELL|nr:hypothetical protein [Cellulomonas xylanilytica]GEK20375.1 hypothetical protein CXY01_08950 [Cellulomonas xylanilytica]